MEKIMVLSFYCCLSCMMRNVRLIRQAFTFFSFGTECFQYFWVSPAMTMRDPFVKENLYWKTRRRNHDEDQGFHDVTSSWLGTVKGFLFRVRVLPKQLRCLTRKLKTTSISSMDFRQLQKVPASGSQ